MKCYYFKVNNSKLDDLNAYLRQVNLVVDRIISRNPTFEYATYKIGTMDYDLLKDKFTLRLTFKQKSPYF